MSATASSIKLKLETMAGPEIAGHKTFRLGGVENEEFIPPLYIDRIVEVIEVVLGNGKKVKTGSHCATYLQIYFPDGTTQEQIDDCLAAVQDLL